MSYQHIFRKLAVEHVAVSRTIQFFYLDTLTMPVHTEIYPQGKQNPTLFCCTSSGDKENNIMSYDDKKEQSGGQKLSLLATGPLLLSSSPDVCPATRMFSF